MDVWVPKVVAIAIGVPGWGVYRSIFIGLVVAVIVDPISADLSTVGMGAARGVIAVGVVGYVPLGHLALHPASVRVPKVIPIPIGVPGWGVHCRIFIGLVVAVIVESISADLGAAGMGGVGGVVAVVCIQDIVVWGRTAHLDGTRVTIGVPIGIGVPHRRIQRLCLVGCLVAVVVHRVTDLDAVRVDGSVGVVAVVSADDLGVMSIPIDIGHVLPGAVVVDAVIGGVYCRRADGLVVVVAVVSADDLGVMSIPIDIGHVLPGAVVVDAVIGGVCYRRVDGFVVVVAVVPTIFRAGEAIVICIGKCVGSLGKFIIGDHLACAKGGK